jgi:hypothetical protein
MPSFADARLALQDGGIQALASGARVLVERRHDLRSARATVIRSRRRFQRPAGCGATIISAAGQTDPAPKTVVALWA